MAAKKRRTNTVVRKTLLENAYRFNFFKAVHLLEGYDRQKALGKQITPFDDPVRFCVKPGFAFPASDIFSLRNGDENPKPVMTVNFMGLIGPNGILPNWYNDYALNANTKKDFIFTDFLDLFHHRLLSLFYLAWKKYRLPENYHPGNKDPVSKSLAGFIGMDERVKKTDPDFTDAITKRLIYFTGLTSRNIPTASAVETIVGNATGITVCVHQFIERMLTIHESDRTCLGKANGTLKKDALCGSRVRDVSSFFEVELGPLSWKKYLAFQPHSKNLRLVRKLITFIVGMEYEFDICLTIKGTQVPSLKLGGGENGDPILGRTVLLKRPEKPYSENIKIKEIVAEDQK